MNKLTTAVWEITMGCNMRCKHCGSSCAEALPDELNTSEALEVCDQLSLRKFSFTFISLLL